MLRVCISVKGWQCIIYHLSRSACKIRDMGSDRLKAPVEPLLKVYEIPLWSCTHLWRVLSLHVTILTRTLVFATSHNKRTNTHTQTQRNSIVSCNFSSVFHDVHEFQWSWKCHQDRSYNHFPLWVNVHVIVFNFPPELPVIFCNNYINTLLLVWGSMWTWLVVRVWPHP